MYNLSAYCVDVASMAVIRTMQQAAAVAVDVDSILQQHINSSCQQGGCNVIASTCQDTGTTPRVFRFLAGYSYANTVYYIAK